MRLSIGAAFLVAGIAGGYVTAMQALSRAGTISAADGSKWIQETINPKDPYGIYALGHYKSEGQLPPPRSAQVYIRLADDDGKALRGDCSYRLAGTAPPARWFSIAAAPVGAAAKATSRTAGETVLTSDDKIEMTLSRRIVPGNWLPLPDASAMEVKLVLQEAYEKNRKGPLVLPSLTKVACE